MQSSLKITVFSILLLIFCAHHVTFASDCSWGSSGGKYCMLAPIPYLSDGNGVVDVYGQGLSSYLKALYRMGIILAIGLSIIMITMGGLRYASTDAIGGKDEGKQMIQQALLGLVLALMSYILLQQINPALLRSDLGNLKPIQNNVAGYEIQGEVDLSNDATTQSYVKMSENPMINTAGVTMINGSISSFPIGGGSVAIDYDGSPGVYRVVEDPNGSYVINGKRYSSVGYENLSNAKSKSGKWVGVQTDSDGQPIVNQDGTLNPVLSWGTGTINGNETAFVALSNEQLSSAKQYNPNFKLGDKVYLTANGKTVEAYYADNAGKRATNYSEVSPAAASALGIPYNRRGVLSDNASVQISVPAPSN